jgi:hypothetical protein
MFYLLDNNNSKFAQHLLEIGYAIGSIKSVMDMLRIINKGNHMNIIKKRYMYMAKLMTKAQKMKTKYLVLVQH